MGELKDRVINLFTAFKRRNRELPDGMGDAMELLLDQQSRIQELEKENARYQKKKDDEQKVRECLWRDHSKLQELCAEKQQCIDKLESELNYRIMADMPLSEQ